jgi:hypothetical protein
MGEQGFQREILIDSVHRDAMDEFDRRNHALDGGVFLSKDSTYGSAGVAPTGKYSGFVVLDTPTISTITFLEPEKWRFAPNEAITTFDAYFVQGAYYPIPFSDLTLTAGMLLLIKKP